MNRIYTGRSYSGFEVGEVFESPGRTVTDAQIVAFAGLSGDFNPLHMDEEYCKLNTAQGCRIAHGALTFTISAGLFNTYVDGTCIAFLDLNFKYTKIVKIGDTLRLEVTVRNKRLTSKQDKGIVEFGVRTLNQNDEAVLEGVWTLMLIL